MAGVDIFSVLVERLQIQFLSYDKFMATNLLKLNSLLTSAHDAVFSRPFVQQFAV